MKEENNKYTVIFRPSAMVPFLTCMARSPSRRRRNVRKPKPFDPCAFDTTSTSSTGPKI